MRTKILVSLSIALIVTLFSSCTTTPKPADVPATEIAPVSECPFNAPAPTQQTPSALYGKTGLANAELSDENFAFTFWLYCDPTLQSKDETENYSVIPSLGVLADWKYNGKKVEGHNIEFFGFGNDIKTSTSWDGPLYRASSGVMSGIYLSEDVAPSSIEAQFPIRFTIGVDSSLGKNGAVFSFTVKKDGEIYTISEIVSERLQP
ncbi:MAG: hypothetical protein LC099_03035 [Anaerolineales bacterium]|nr:hypothetical protein [Anaerolineales bacterium]